MHFYTFSRNKHLHKCKVLNNWFCTHSVKEKPKSQNYNGLKPDHPSTVSDKTHIITGYMNNILYGKQPKFSILLIRRKAYNMANATQLWVCHKRCKFAKAQVRKTPSKPINSRKLFMIIMVSDQEDPEQRHFNI